jgi:hypothetical protein
MSNQTIAITPLQLLEGSSGELIDRSQSVPSLGSSAYQVAIRDSTDLTRTTVSGATELFVFSSITAKTTLPAVTSLWLASGATVSRQTAEAFVGLENLRVESRQRVGLEWFRRSPLCGLALTDRAIEDWNRMSKNGMSLDNTKRLERLSVDCRMSGELPLLKELRLRSLVIRSRKRPRQLKEIWALSTLTRLQLLGVPLADLRAAHELSSLSYLRVGAPKSLTGISELKALRTLIVYGRTCPLVQELPQVAGLRELELTIETLPSDFVALGDCESLECLRLELGNITTTVQIDLGFLRGLKRLKRLALCGVSLGRSDLSVLEHLEGLEDVVLTGDLGGVTQAALMRHSPMARITVSDVSEGNAHAPKRIGQEWILFRDLAAALGVNDNYDAEAVIKKELNRTAPDVLSKLAFDSEAGAVSVASRDRDAIEAVFRIVKALERAKTS